ncbi:MAG TPA: hypothetical protein VFA78_01610 [Chloroflexota bacterium]|nr:hypothetical protein [Chloroflexota bacterium]
MHVHELHSWLGALPTELAAQRNLLIKILDVVERDERWRWLEEQARTQIWRLWAVTTGVPDPQYGLTAVFDHPAVGEPPTIAGTIAGLSAADIHRAALAAADLLDRVSNMAAEAIGGDAPGAMGSYVTGLLRTADGRQM